MTDTLKLYKVELCGILERFNPAYAVATNPDEAYKIIRQWLDDNDYGFTKDRQLRSVTLLAEVYQYTDTGSRLFINQTSSLTKY